MFVKLHVDAFRSGLVADIGAERWQTLCAIASYMDANGRCYPSQSRLAADMGVKRETANRRVQALLRYRWRGEPVILAEKQRDVTGWANTVYTVMPAAGLTFG